MEELGTAGAIASGWCVAARLACWFQSKPWVQDVAGFVEHFSRSVTEVSASRSGRIVVSAG